MDRERGGPDNRMHEILQPLRIGPDRARRPAGDHVPRFVCAACGTVHYQNPKLVVGCLPEWEDRVLLCRRAIEPRHGLWTLPAGFLENNETLHAGAARETLEEARARVEIGTLYTMISLPQISQVYVIFRARLVDLDFGPGPESLEVRLFHEDEIPWEELAFRTIAPDATELFPRPEAGRVSDAGQHARAAPARGRSPRPAQSGPLCRRRPQRAVSGRLFPKTVIGGSHR